MRPSTLVSSLAFCHWSTPPLLSTAYASISAVIKVLAGVALGYVLFTQPQARQVTADLLRAAADALSPAEGTKTPQERLNGLITGQ